jgi:hypothetical protein
VDWCCLDSRGDSGGVLIMWGRKVVKKIDECVREFALAVTFKNVEDNFTWTFVSVYGPNFDRDRRLIWDELVDLLNWWDLPWCIGVDFNVTWFPSKRFGVACLCPAMMEFLDFIFD